MATIRKDPRGSGRWQVIYRDANGRQRTKGGFERKREAERWATATQADIQRGEFVDPARGRVRLGDFAARWLAEQHQLKEKTRRDYAQIIEGRLIPDLGRTPVGRLDHERVQDYVNELTTRYAPGTVRKTVAVLKRMLGAAVRQGYVRANPADGVSLPRPRQREMLFLNAEQVEALAAAVPNQFSTLVRFAAWTGLRAGELCALRVRDFVDEDLSAVRVTRSLADVAGRLVEGETKTGRNRVVGVPSALRDDLRAHLIRLYPTGHDAEAIVFPGERGGHLRHANFYRRHFRPAVAAALPDSLADLRFHDLRHTAAALMISLGAHPKEIADRLGHSTISVTMDTYGHIFPDRQEALTASLDAALRAARG